MKTFEKIRLMRELNHWSQEEVADKLGLSTNGYAKIERGETKLNIPRLEQIATVFNVDLWDLVQPENKGFVCQINEGDNNSDISFYAYPSQEWVGEIEKLKLTIRHQQEMLAQKDILLQQKQEENLLLKELLAQLRQK
ncbi:helix-turn-helix transcriptional regulator [Neisseria sp. ZJ106]|uniref:Helix-turn-helix transcriptional regulator n=1 Tax=Neisseria lisongii TaxID=2912188 RepID=A0ABY7RJA0_9NEIS|nr:helix-turn-helix transcriptional regulator [Neisseria lisongii]MCF7520928.1 helix-turn-helix transcriptional regulator [Neisseria lisongii]WCL71268.1 helix-turn-helix transcriptional regulator [Neisseria lisongii]